MINSKLTFTDTAIYWASTDARPPFREHGPSYISNTGYLEFSQCSSQWLSRTNGGPSSITADGNVSYTNHEGQLHRTTGPALIYGNGNKEYFVNGFPWQPVEFFSKYKIV